MVVAPKLPFNLPINAQLTLSKDTGTTSTDPATGNIYPVRETIEVNCSLTRVPVSGKTKDQLGADPELIQLQGWILNPPSNIDEYEISGTVYAVFTDLNLNLDYPGEFTFDRVVTGFNSVLANIGIPIRGTFKLLEGRSDAQPIIVIRGRFWIASVIDFEGSFYYYGGNQESGDWKINRFAKDELSKTSATQSNNSGYSTLIEAWNNRSSLVYESV